MQIILAVALLLSITDPGYTWGNFYHGGWPKQYELPDSWFTPSRHSFNHRGHKHPVDREESTPQCPLLEQLFSFKVNQLKNEVGATCTAAWICRDPVTGDMAVTDADGRQITINEHWQMNTRPTQNGDQKNENYKCPNSNAENMHNTEYPENINDSKEEATTSTAQVPSTQPQTTQTTGMFGEGLIDVRIGTD